MGLNAEEHIEVDANFLRPAEVDFLQGDATKAHETLGWQPEISLEEMVQEMVEADMARVRQGLKAGIEGLA